MYTGIGCLLLLFDYNDSVSEVLFARRFVVVEVDSKDIRFFGNTLCLVHRDVDRGVFVDPFFEYDVQGDTHSVTEADFDIDSVCDDSITRFV